MMPVAFRLKAASLELKRHQALQVAMVKEEIEFEILIAHLHSDLLADKGKSIAEFHQEFPQIPQQRGLQIGLLVALRQVEKI